MQKKAQSILLNMFSIGAILVIFSPSLLRFMLSVLLIVIVIPIILSLLLLATRARKLLSWIQLKDTIQQTSREGKQPDSCNDSNTTHPNTSAYRKKKPGPQVIECKEYYVVKD